jgi:hypothetical protein
MRVDELRRTLDDAAGPPPDPFPARDAVLSRARARRRRDRVLAGMAAGATLVAALTVTFVLVRHARDDRVRVTGAGVSRAAGLRWRAEPSPLETFPRIVRAGSSVYLVGTTGDAAVVEVDTGSGWRTVFRGAAGGRYVRRPAVNDLVEHGRLLVAVGQDVAFSTGEVGAAAWWSGDGGHTWTRATVPQPPGAGSVDLADAPLPGAAITHLVESGGRWYAFGGTYAPRGVAFVQCSPLAWVSTDGMHWTVSNVAPLFTVTTRCSTFVGAAVGPDGLIAMTSTADVYELRGGVWFHENTTGDLPAPLLGIFGDRDGYLAFGGDATIAWSADGRHWTRVLDGARVADGAPSRVRIVDVARAHGRFLAVGVATPGPSPAITDAIAFVSSDGRSWTAAGRGSAVFASRARADSVAAAPAGGFAVVGGADMRGTGALTDPIRQRGTVWHAR